MKRFITQTWWRLFGERCPCGMSFRRKGSGSLLSVCCFADMLTKAFDAAWEQQRSKPSVEIEGGDKYATWWAG